MLVQVSAGNQVRVKVSRAGGDYAKPEDIGKLIDITFYLGDKYIYITAEEWEQLKEMVDNDN
jgi:hypothetical protein